MSSEFVEVNIVCFASYSTYYKHLSLYFHQKGRLFFTRKNKLKYTIFPDVEIKLECNIFDYL